MCMVGCHSCSDSLELLFVELSGCRRSTAPYIDVLLMLDMLGC